MVGLICALPIEAAAAMGMLDEHHDHPPSRRDDNNIYTLGRIGDHNVVIACLPPGLTGRLSAANVAIDMLRTFTGLRIGLMVGIGGGVPSERHDIRLGDVVVSSPTGTSSGGMVQLHFSKPVQLTGRLSKPPNVLLTALANLQAKHIMESQELSNDLSKMIGNMMRKYPRMGTQYRHPGAQYDFLYEAEYDHSWERPTRSECDVSRLVNREPRRSEDPVVHYGLTASGNAVMKHGATRDKLSKELDVLCFEMEAAGLIDSYPCVVIRGICDYADSHKSKRWQAYAAAAAAAYAKELLGFVPGQEITSTVTTIEVKGVDKPSTVRDDQDSIHPLSDYAMQKFQAFQWNGIMEDLEEAIRCGKEEVQIISQDDPDLAGRLNNLSIMLGNRFDITGDSMDLAEAIASAKQAIEATSKDHLDLSGRLDNLGNQLLRRFQRTGILESLEEAIDTAKRAVATTPEGHHSLPGKLNNLSIMLRSHFARTGRKEDLERAIRKAEQALETTPDDHLDMAIYLDNLGIDLISRFDQTQNMEDLDKAICLVRKSVAMTPVDHSRLAERRSNLSVMLSKRFDITGRKEDMGEAVRAAERVFKVTSEFYSDPAVNPTELLSVTTSNTPPGERVASSMDSAISSGDSQPDTTSQLPSSATSISAASARVEEFTQGLIRLLMGDEDIWAHSMEAIKKSYYEPKFARLKIERKLHRLLFQFSKELKKRSSTFEEKETAKFLRNHSRLISKEFFQIMQIAQKLPQTMANLLKEPVEKLQLNRFLEDYVSPGNIDISEVDDVGLNDGQAAEQEREEVISVSSDESEASQVTELNLGHSLETVKGFLVSGEPFSKLRRGFEDFVQHEKPSQSTPTSTNNLASTPKENLFPGISAEVVYTSIRYRLGVFLRIFEKPVRPGYLRLSWTCVSEYLYDDWKRIRLIDRRDVVASFSKTLINNRLTCLHFKALCTRNFSSRVNYWSRIQWQQLMQL
jgi:nucleoside phosphorylase